MNKLQNIVFPKPGICFDQDMFYRVIPIPWRKTSPYRFDAGEQCLCVDEGGIVFFDTYFNGLSIGKWKKYSTVKDFSLRLELSGNFSVSLLHTKYINGNIVQKILKTELFELRERQSITMLFPECEAAGIISFRIDSLKDGGAIYTGAYLAANSEDEPREIGLALNICNYQREEYIYRNIGIIQQYILDNSDSELRKHLHVFVADNSQTIDSKKLPKGCSHVFPQGDFGGAGGFTRGLMEVLNVQNEKHLTHIIMMDDDVLLEPESLERLYSFLRYMRPEYQSAFVGGALHRMDYQYIQTCHGGEWDMRKTYCFHKCNYVLTDLKTILLNEIEDGAKLNAWWFHCIPLSEVSSSNLPYPFFFHMDDTEYDLRNCRHVIHLNGICVWHEPFEYKPGSHLSYYNTRNILITHMLHFKELNLHEAKRYLWCEFTSPILIYRYREASLVLRGVEDALKGPEWLVTQNPEGLLEDVLTQGYDKQSIDVLPMRLDYGKYLAAFQGQPAESKMQRICRRLSLNGYLNKANHDAIVPMYDPQIRSVYRAKRVLNYDPVSNRGFITEKSYKELFRLLWRYLKVRRLLNRRFEKARQEYLDAFPSMTNSTFWYQYLGVTQESEDGVGV